VVIPKAKRRQANEQERRTAGELAAIAESYSARPLQVTCGLYQPGNNDEPELIGSGVLLSVGPAKFLVTAGHVLDRRKDAPFFVGVSPELLSLSGDVTRWRTVGAKTDAEDTIDVGAVRLEGEHWKDVPPEAFATWDEIDLNVPILERHSFGLVGFPNSSNRRSVAEARIVARAYRLAGLECDESAYRAEKREPETNLMLGLEPKEMWTADGLRSAPDLYGTSGCGIWRYGRRLRDTQSPPRLSAIATEWKKKGQNTHILGTRIHIVVSAMADKYEDVRSFVEVQLNQETS
jgi:hypothetical protein